MPEWIIKALKYSNTNTIFRGHIFNTLIILTRDRDYALRITHYTNKF